MYNLLSVSKGNYPNLAIECRTMCSLSSFCSQLFHIFPPNTSLLIRLGIICALRKLLVPPWGNFSDRFYEEAFSARPCWKNNFWHSHPCKEVLGSAASRLSLIWLWGLHALPPCVYVGSFWDLQSPPVVINIQPSWVKIQSEPWTNDLMKIWVWSPTAAPQKSWLPFDVFVRVTHKCTSSGSQTLNDPWNTLAPLCLCDPIDFFSITRESAERWCKLTDNIQRHKGEEMSTGA